MSCGDVIMREKIQDIFFIILGGILMGFSLSFLLVPSQIIAGGASGISTILNHLFNLPVGFMVLIINIPVFILGFIAFDAKFLLTSLLGTMALSFSAEFFELGMFDFAKLVSDDMLIASVFGGLLYGLGLGLAIRGGGTTGGTDILALVFKKWFPSMSIGQFMTIIDGLIILTAGIAFRRVDTMLYSIIMLYVCSKIVDTIVEGVDFAKMVYVISDMNKEIADEIAKHIERGSTALSGFSMYSGKNRNVLMCVMRKNQFPKLKKIVANIDDRAFVIVTDAREVIGEGFGIRNKIT